MQQASTWLAAGRYEVGEVVGRGGYGMVCRGFDRKTGQRVALKMLSPEAGRDPDVVERMLREQQALVALSGTCAVTAIDLCRLESGAPCLVMEWLEGRDLEQQLAIWEAAGQRGSVPQLREILRAVTLTLTRAHDIGIVHRDIKPANIFLVEAPVAGARLLDFGLSRMKSAAPLTAMGMVMGSPSYIAPETWRGNSSLLDGRADLFALAVIVFRYLTGKLPFEAPDLIGKMTAVTSGPRPSVVALRPDLPQALDAWMSRALAVEASDRFQTGGDFFAAFEAALRGEMLAVSADVSGVRAIDPESKASADGDRKGTLLSAFRAAATLLKRFTQPRDRATPTPSAPPPTVVSAPPTEVAATHPAPTGYPARREPTPLITAHDEPAPQSERHSVWLDSEELQDFAETSPDSAPMTLRSEPPPEPSSTPVAAAPEPAIVELPPVAAPEAPPAAASSEPVAETPPESRTSAKGKGPSKSKRGDKKPKTEKKPKTQKKPKTEKPASKAKKPRAARKK